MTKFSKNSSVLILSHYLLSPLDNDSAASTAIRNHLLPKVGKLVQIEQPFSESKDDYFYKLIFEGGIQKSKKAYIIIKKPLWLAYIFHPLVAFFEVLVSNPRFDITIACESLSFLAVIPFRKIGLVKKLVYYSVDYVPERFRNRFVNSIYHFLDRIACYNSDLNWVVAKEQIDGRFENGVKRAKSSPFRIVPIGFRLSEIEVKPISKIKYYNLVFVGTVRPSAGARLIVEALPKIAKKFPKIKVTFAGGGEYIGELKELARKLKVTKHVEFLGYIDKHKDLVKLVTDKSIGLAPYAPELESISQRSDPGKIKLYLACGLPVITTQVATSSQTIERGEAGLVIDYDKERLSKAVVDILKDKKRYKKYKKAALLLSQEYDVDKILGRALV